MRPPFPDDGRRPRIRRDPAIPGRRGTARVVSAVLAASLAGAALALDSDYGQPIDVNADRAEYDQRAGTQTLIGNVEIRQGTIRITADRVTISLGESRFARIEGSGSPIRFQQENEAGETIVGEASRIAYDASDSTLVLSGGATLSQPGQSLESESISFDARTQAVRAEGGGTAADGTGGKGRVSIRLDAPPLERPR